MSSDFEQAKSRVCQSEGAYVTMRPLVSSWEQRKLGDCVGSTYGGGTPSTSHDEYWGGNIPWIQSSNVLENELFRIDIPKAITQDGLSKSAALRVPGDSIAVVTHVASESSFTCHFRTRQARISCLCLSLKETLTSFAMQFIESYSQSFIWSKAQLSKALPKRSF